MTAPQLTLIDEVDVNRAHTAVPARSPRKFVAPSNLPYTLVLQALLQGPKPVAQLREIAGTGAGPNILHELRQLGLELICCAVPILDSDGPPRPCLVCMLTATDSKRITRWLKNSGGRHG